MSEGWKLLLEPSSARLAERFEAERSGDVPPVEKGVTLEADLSSELSRRECELRFTREVSGPTREKKVWWVVCGWRGSVVSITRARLLRPVFLFGGTGC